VNLRSGRGSTSAGAGRDLEGHGENGHDNGNGESHETPLLGPPLPPPPPPPMTHAEMMAKMLAAHHESAHAMKLLAQAIGGFVRGGPSGNGGNGGSAHGLEGPCSYQDFLKTHPPMFTLTAEPQDAEHWLRILEQKF
jgi:hypothetical protein